MLSFIYKHLASAGFSVGLTAILGFILKMWFTVRLESSVKAEYDRHLEEHKDRLKKETDAEIEKLKAQLNITATEKRIVFEKLHEKRAEAISQLYWKLKLFYDTVCSLVDWMGTPASQAKRYGECVEQYEAFYNIFIEKQIFIPLTAKDKIETIKRTLAIEIRKFKMFVMTDHGIQKTDEWNNIETTVKEKFPAVFQELENEFRNLLGEK